MQTDRCRDGLGKPEGRGVWLRLVAQGDRVVVPRGLVPVTIPPSPSTIAAAPCSNESGKRVVISDRQAITAASSWVLSTASNLGAHASLDDCLRFPKPVSAPLSPMSGTDLLVNRGVGSAA